MLHSGRSATLLSRGIRSRHSETASATTEPAAFSGLDRNARGLTFEVSRSGATVQVGRGDVHPDGGLTHPEQTAGVGGGGNTDHLHERVEGELLGGALVAQDRVGAGDGVGVDEARATPVWIAAAAPIDT